MWIKVILEKNYVLNFIIEVRKILVSLQRSIIDLKMSFKTIFNNDADIINLKILGNFLIDVEIRQDKTL
ncbi:hypothetical protein [Terrisporobacter sp.]|uniref:hypothetical protein n=1 Tax=Terrisporobacter sp. TaxID=1965305 RepID=UPI00289C3A35|nr:hypothetical protein [Terrisporobacter sp.]